MLLKFLEVAVNFLLVFLSALVAYETVFRFLSLLSLDLYKIQMQFQFSSSLCTSPLVLGLFQFIYFSVILSFLVVLFAYLELNDFQCSYFFIFYFFGFRYMFFLHGLTLLFFFM